MQTPFIAVFPDQIFQLGIVICRYSSLTVPRYTQYQLSLDKQLKSPQTLFLPRLASHRTFRFRNIKGKRYLSLSDHQLQVFSDNSRTLELSSGFRPVEGIKHCALSLAPDYKPRVKLLIFLRGKVQIGKDEKELR